MTPGWVTAGIVIALILAYLSDFLRGTAVGMLAGILALVVFVLAILADYVSRLNISVRNKN